MAPKKAPAAAKPKAAKAPAKKKPAAAPAKPAKAAKAAPKARAAAAAPAAKKPAPAPKKAAPAAKKAAASSSSGGGGGGKNNKVAVGGKLPEFSVVDHEGGAVTSADLLARCGRGIVLFAYPKANTPGCHKQACGMRDNHAELQALGFDVYGISADNPTPQANWRAKGGFPFTLLCDKGRAALKALGIDKGGVSIHRSHFVIAKDGTVLQAMVGVSPGESIEGALAGAKEAAAGK